MKPKDYESTVMRMAGNIAAGIAPQHGRTHTAGGYRSVETWEIEHKNAIAAESVALARAIVAEVHRTAPDPPKETL